MVAALSTFAGNAIYVDTMMPYMLLRGVGEAQPFFERLERSELSAYTSVLTFDELGYRLLLALIKDRYGGSPLDRLHEQEEKMLAEFALTVSSLLKRLLAYTNLTVLDVLVSDLEVVNDVMPQYRLRPRDAIHYAAMQRANCMNLASNDSDFDRIPAIKRYAL
jgi:predicted nucleic acid-binding protein